MPMVSQKRPLVKPLKINLVNNLWITQASKKVYLFRTIKKIKDTLYTPMAITYISLIYPIMIYIIWLW